MPLCSSHELALKDVLSLGAELCSSLGRPDGITREYRELKSLSHAQAVSPALSQPLPRSLAKAKRHGQQETRLVRESSLNKSNFYRSPTAPPSVPSLSTGVSQGEDTIERDDWWYEETKNVLLNRSGERRTFICLMVHVTKLTRKEQIS